MSNYASDINSSREPRPFKSPYIRQLNRALDMASDPYFENDRRRRGPGEQYNATWREVTHADLMPYEIDRLRLSIGTHWLDVHPERVQRCDEGPYRRAMLLDPRKAGPAPPQRFRTAQEVEAEMVRQRAENIKAMDGEAVDTAKVLKTWGEGKI